MLSHFISGLFSGSGAFSGLSYINQCHGTLFFPPSKTEKRVEERDVSWVHQPPLFLPAAFTHLEAQVHSLSAAKNFKSSQCICRGFLQVLLPPSLAMQGRPLQCLMSPLVTSPSMPKPWTQGHRGAPSAKPAVPATPAPCSRLLQTQLQMQLRHTPAVSKCQALLHCDICLNSLSFLQTQLE